jgi:hypothetical protein
LLPLRHPLEIFLPFHSREAFTLEKSHEQPVPIGPLENFRNQFGDETMLNFSRLLLTIVLVWIFSCSPEKQTSENSDQKMNTVTSSPSTKKSGPPNSDVQTTTVTLYYGNSGLSLTQVETTFSVTSFQPSRDEWLASLTVPEPVFHEDGLGADLQIPKGIAIVTVTTGDEEQRVFVPDTDEVSLGVVADDVANTAADIFEAGVNSEAASDAAGLARSDTFDASGLMDLAHYMVSTLKTNTDDSQKALDLAAIAKAFFRANAERVTAAEEAGDAQLLADSLRKQKNKAFAASAMGQKFKDNTFDWHQTVNDSETKDEEIAQHQETLDRSMDFLFELGEDYDHLVKVHVAEKIIRGVLRKTAELLDSTGEGLTYEEKMKLQAWVRAKIAKAQREEVEELKDDDSGLVTSLAEDPSYVDGQLEITDEDRLKSYQKHCLEAGGQWLENRCHTSQTTATETQTQTDLPSCSNLAQHSKEQIEQFLTSLGNSQNTADSGRKVCTVSDGQHCDDGSQISWNGFEHEQRFGALQAKSDSPGFCVLATN